MYFEIETWSMPRSKLIVVRRRRRSLWWTSLAALVRKPSTRSCSRYEVEISRSHVQVGCHGVMRSKYYRYNAIMSWTHVSGTVEQRNTSKVFAFTSVFEICPGIFICIRICIWKIFELRVYPSILDHKKCHISGTSPLPNGFSTSPTWSELLTARTTASGRRGGLRARDLNRSETERRCWWQCRQ